MNAPHIVTGFEIGDLYENMVLIRFQILPPGSADMSSVVWTEPLAILPGVAEEISKEISAALADLRLLDRTTGKIGPSAMN